MCTLLKNNYPLLQHIYQKYCSQYLQNEETKISFYFTCQTTPTVITKLDSLIITIIFSSDSTEKNIISSNLKQQSTITPNFHSQKAIQVSIRKLQDNIGKHVLIFPQ